MQQLWLANIDLFWINRQSNQETAPEALARCPLTVNSVANVLTYQDSWGDMKEFIPDKSLMNVKSVANVLAKQET